ncbi:hypothetical protein D1AOALGA4SA_291 [Olavius algarvensis Delta 1 endosymbiont]|nr:hypothetical protein D1AOALGA4SA_291 [Olavius algarvensis Delta 1 endosymbiont]
MPFNLFTAFHVNLAYSSIPASHYGWVLDNCYWPLLDLCKSLQIKMGIEFSGQTLRRLSELDPLLFRTLKDLIQGGLVEPICGGEYQSIGPLLPFQDNLFNYQAGKDTFRSLLNWDAKLLYLPEQTISRGLLDTILKADFSFVLLEWNNAKKYGGLGFSDRTLYGCPQLAHSDSGRLRIIWNHSVVFQKVQRYVFGDIPMHEVTSYLMLHESKGGGGLCFYGSDLEVFGYYPGNTIQEKSRLANERWKRFRTLVVSLQGDSQFLLPSEAADLCASEEKVEVGQASSPILCKKQPKYNPVRWAVCGRGASQLNAECFRLSLEMEILKQADLISSSEESRLRSLLAPCWASDYRTFTTEEKWTQAGVDIARAKIAQNKVKRNLISKLKPDSQEILFFGSPESRGASVYDLAVQFPPGNVFPGANATNGGKPLPTQWEEVQCYRDGSIRQARVAVILDTSSSHCHKIGFVGHDMALVTKPFEFQPQLENDSVHISWNCRRGLCIDSAAFPSFSTNPVFGTIAHGFFDSIEWDADFYSGGVQLDDGHHLFHDLVPVENVGCWSGPIRDIVEVKVSVGPVIQRKRYFIYHDFPRIDLEQTFLTKGLSSLAFRAGIVTLLPRGWRREKLMLMTQNGGRYPEIYPLTGSKVTHSDPSKTGVSSSNCLGATGGWIAFGDGEKTLTISRDMMQNYMVPLIKYEEIGPHFFARVYHTLGERDETSLFSYRGHLSTRFALILSPGKSISPGYTPHMVLQATSVT